MRDDRLRLADMLEAIELIERYAQRGRVAWEAVVRDLPELKKRLLEIVETSSRTGDAS